MKKEKTANSANCPMGRSGMLTIRTQLCHLAQHSEGLVNKYFFELINKAMIKCGRLVKIHWQNCQIMFLSPNSFHDLFGKSGRPDALRTYLKLPTTLKDFSFLIPAYLQKGRKFCIIFVSPTGPSKEASREGLLDQTYPYETHLQIPHIHSSSLPLARPWLSCSLSVSQLLLGS